MGLIAPYVKLITTLNGPDRRTVEPHELELRSPPMKRSPYANLIFEMLQDDPTLFIRGEEAEEA